MIKKFFVYLLLAAVILLMSGGVSWFLNNTMKPDCKIYIDSKDPTNLIISSNCKVTTTNTTKEVTND